MSSTTSTKGGKGKPKSSKFDLQVVGLHTAACRRPPPPRRKPRLLKTPPTLKPFSPKPRPPLSFRACYTMPKTPDHLSSLLWPTGITLVTLATLRTHCKLGLATKLMTADQNAMESIFGAEYIFLHVHHSNHTAINLYTSTLGYIIHDVEAKYYAAHEVALVTPKLPIHGSMPASPPRLAGLPSSPSSSPTSDATTRHRLLHFRPPLPWLAASLATAVNHPIPANSTARRYLPGHRPPPSVPLSPPPAILP